MAGERLTFPPPDELPGAGAAGFEQGLPAYMQLAERCWAQDPAERPSFQQIIVVLRWAPMCPCVWCAYLYVLWCKC